MEKVWSCAWRWAAVNNERRWDWWIECCQFSTSLVQNYTSRDLISLLFSTASSLAINIFHTEILNFNKFNNSTSVNIWFILINWFDNVFLKVLLIDLINWYLMNWKKVFLIDLINKYLMNFNSNFIISTNLFVFISIKLKIIIYLLLFYSMIIQQ